MPIQNTGSNLRLRGNSGDGVTDINEEINSADPYTGEVKLSEVNAAIFPNITDGSVITGRAMSEMQGQSLFDSAFPSTEAEGALGESLLLNSNDSTFLRFTPSLTGNELVYTVSCWVKKQNDNTVYLLGSKNGSYLDGGIIQLSGNTVSYSVNGNVYNKNFIIPTLDYSSWYHFVMAIDHTKSYVEDRIRLYINGIEIKEYNTANSGLPPQNYNSPAFNQSSVPMDIGMLAGYFSSYADITIADFKFIDGKQLRPDSFGELVQGIWIPKAFNTATGESLVTSNLRANIQFSSNGKFTEEQGNHSISNSGVDIIKNNYGVSHYNNVNDRFILADTDNSNNIFDNGLSISAWVRVDNFASDNHAIVRNKASSDQKGINFNVGTSGRLNFGVHMLNNTTSVQADDMLKEGTWHHVVGTTDGSANTNAYKLYIDGVLVATETPSTSIASIGTFSFDAAIGNRPGSYSLDNFGGQIGEIQLYTDQLTDAEVLQNYNATKHKYTYGLNGFWLPLNNTSTGSIDSSSNLKLHLDASNSSSYTGSGTTWSDLSGNLANATLNGVTFLSSTNGGVFDFDGSNDDATIDDTKINYSNFSLEFWINPDTNLTAYNTLFSRYSTTASQNTWHIRGNDTNNGIEFIRYPSGVNGATFKDNSVVSANKWTHIIVTHDETYGVLKIYKNGALDATHSIGGNLVTGSTTDLLIGNLQGYNFRYNGQLAQVRFYNDILTAQEVITNYRATQGNYEQVSTVDISGNANSFTATNIDATDHVKDEPLDNHATLISGTTSTAQTISDGNLKIINTSSNFYSAYSNIGVKSGKWYAEAKVLDEGNNTLGVGVSTESALYIKNTSNQNGLVSGNVHWNLDNDSTPNYATIYPNGNYSASTPQQKAVDGDVIGVELNADNNEVTFYYNGSQFHTTQTINRTGDEEIFFWTTTRNHLGQGILLWNFGQKPWAYGPSTGYKALSTKNLAAPAFDPDGSTPDKPSNYFKAVTYQGNGGTQGEAYGYKEGSRAAVFNGSSSSINLGSNVTKQLPMTVSCWLNPVTNSNAAFYSNYSSSTEGFYCRVQSDGTFLIDAYNGGSNRTLLNNTTGSIPDNTWSHVAITLDTSNIILYINGSETDRVSTNANGIAFTASEPTKLGVRGTSSDWYNGKMDELRIFDKVLSPTEVGYLANDDTSNIDAISNLVAYYDMEGDANDSSGYAVVDDHYFFVGDLGNQLTDVRVNTEDSEFTYTKPSGYDPWAGALNPSNTSGSQTFNFTESNKRWTKVSTSGYYNTVWSTLAHNTGKKYFEIEFLNKNIQFGISKLTTADNWTNNTKNNSIVYVDYVTSSYEYSTTDLNQGQVIYPNTNGSSVIGIACDFDNQTFYYYYNNSLVDTAAIASTNYNGTDTNVTYTQDKPYGNINVGFTPDLVWIKNRSSSDQNHAFFDSVEVFKEN